MMALSAAQKQKRYRERKSNANVTKAVTNDEVTQPADVTAICVDAPGLPDNFGTADCGCWMCQNYRAKGKTTEYLNHGKPMTAEELGKVSPLARNRQALPGDTDYTGTASRTQAREQARLERAEGMVCSTPVDDMGHHYQVMRKDRQAGLQALTHQEGKDVGAKGTEAGRAKAGG